MRTETLTALVLVMTGCTSPVVASPSASAPRVKFEIRIPDQVGVGEQGNPIRHAGRPAEMTFTNESDRPLWINTLARIGPSVLPGRNEVRLTIRGSSGEAAYLCKGRALLPTSASYKVLKPGEKITSTDDTLWCYDLFKEPGKYTAQAVYHDETRQPPPAPPGIDRVSEELIAQPVQFEVLAN